MTKRLLPLVLLLCGCGNPDNLVIGSISSYGGAPVVLFDHIRSNLHGTVNVTDPQTKATHRVDVIIISDRADLCAAIAANPAYLTSSTDAQVSLVLTAKLDSVGTYYVRSGRPDDADVAYSRVLAANPSAASGPAQQSYPVVAGSLAVTNFDLGGEASGSFDLVFITPDNQGRELAGRYKTHACTALAGVTLP